MKLLGFRESPGVDTTGEGRRDPRAGLFHEDRERFARWIDHLTGADPRLREWAPRLRSGEGVVVLTGQQPALLGGPLYTLYKTLTAIATARSLRTRGTPAIAAFWCVGDDTDLGEVSWASWPVRYGPPRRVRDESAPQGERIGLLASTRMGEALRQLHEDWPAHPLPRSITDTPADNWSRFLEQSLRFLSGEEPLLFVDGNDPEAIRASQSWLRGFVPRRSEIADGIERLARAVGETEGRPSLEGDEALRALFLVEGRSRRVLDAEGAVGPDALLLPNVVLRPALQEYLLPVERVVCGEGEIAYRRLLGPAYAAAGRSPAPWMLRFSATLFPPSWLGLRESIDPIRAVDRTDDAIDAMTRDRIDPALLREVEARHARILEILNGLGAPIARIDRSLPQLLDSVTGKVDFQIRRVQEAILTKARAALLREHPVLANLREVLCPRGRPQERSFSMWTPFAIEGIGAIRDLERAVDAWLERGGSGHALLALEETVGSGAEGGSGKEAR